MVATRYDELGSAMRNGREIHDFKLYGANWVLRDMMERARV